MGVGMNGRAGPGGPAFVMSGHRSRGASGIHRGPSDPGVAPTHARPSIGSTTAGRQRRWCATDTALGRPRGIAAGGGRHRGCIGQGASSMRPAQGFARRDQRSECAGRGGLGWRQVVCSAAVAKVRSGPPSPSCCRNAVVTDHIMSCCVGQVLRSGAPADVDKSSWSRRGVLGSGALASASVGGMSLDPRASLPDLLQSITDVESVSGNEEHLADLVEAAARLFDTLREADRMAGPGGRIAFAPVPEMGLGRAINDRLRRAAAPRS